MKEPLETTKKGWQQIGLCVVLSAAGWIFLLMVVMAAVAVLDRVGR